MKSSLKILPFLYFVLFLQGCSWRHFFEVKNTTNDIWEISYEINDLRGIFKTEVNIKRFKDTGKLQFENSKVSFKLGAGEIARIGMSPNSHYKVYKFHKEFDPETPWTTFINVKNINLSSKGKVYSLDASQLSPFLLKNNRDVARIDLKKVLTINKE